MCYSKSCLTNNCDRLERTLRFPRNGAADGTGPDTVRASELTLASDYIYLCSSAQYAVSRNGGPIHDQALAALNQASTFHNDLVQLDAVTFFDQLTTRARREPRTGICDAIFVTPVRLGTGKSRGELKARGYLQEFGLIQSPAFTPPVDKKSVIQSPAFTPPADKKSGDARSKSLLSLPLESLTPKQKKLLKNPLYVSCTESQSASTLSIPGNHSLFDSDHILLAGFVAEYKKHHYGEDKALNQEHTYMVALVMFLDVLGIRGFPVFGLITSSQTRGVLMAWMSEAEKVRVLVIINDLPVSSFILLAEDIYHRVQYPDIQSVQPH
jgi:hypothetical protein